MPRKKKPTKLDMLRSRIADARRIIDAQQALLETLRNNEEPTREAEAALRTYVSALMHLLTHEERLRLEAEAKRRARPRNIAAQKEPPAKAPETGIQRLV
jgi:hypothetical protein